MPPRARARPRHRAADGDLMRQNKMLDVDERARDEQTDEEPEAEHHRSPFFKGGPVAADLPEHGVKQQAGEQLNAEVSR